MTDMPRIGFDASTAARVRELIDRVGGDRAGELLGVRDDVLELLIAGRLIDDAMSQPQPTSDNGEWTVEIELLEFRPPRPTVVRVAGAQAGAVVPPVPDPFDRAIDVGAGFVQALRSGDDATIEAYTRAHAQELAAVGFL